jgi:hypothetical protein
VALYGHGSRGGGARGGRAITFASDAHTTDALAGNFYEAMAMVARNSAGEQRLPEPADARDERQGLAPSWAAQDGRSRSFQSTSEREVGGLPAAKISGSAKASAQQAPVRSGRFRGSARSLPYRSAASPRRAQPNKP